MNLNKFVNRQIRNKASQFRFACDRINWLKKIIRKWGKAAYSKSEFSLNMCAKWLDEELAIREG